MADPVSTMSLFNLRDALHKAKLGFPPYVRAKARVTVHADDLETILDVMQAHQSRKPDLDAQDGEDTVKRVREHLRGEADYCERGLLRDLLRAYEAKGASS